MSSWLFFILILALSMFGNNVLAATPDGSDVFNLSKVQDKNNATNTTLRTHDTSTSTKISAVSEISKKKEASVNESGSTKIISFHSYVKNASVHVPVNKTAKSVEEITSKATEIDVTIPLNKGNKDTGGKVAAEQADLLSCCVTPHDDDNDDDDNVKTDENIKMTIHSTTSTVTTVSSNSTANNITITISNVTTSNMTANNTSIATTMKSTTTISTTTPTTLVTVSSTAAEKNNSLNANSVEPPQVFPTDKDVKSIETVDRAIIAKLNHMINDTVPSELDSVTKAVTNGTLNTNATFPNEEVEMRNNSVTPVVMQDVQYVGSEDKKKEEDNNGSMPSGVIALVTAITFAVAIVLAYVTMVVWRQYLEHKYGRRELLVNDLEFDTNDLRHFEL